MSHFAFVVGLVTLGTACVQFANGILGSTLPIRLDEAGFPVQAISIVLTGHAAGFFVGSFFAGLAAREAGLGRSLVATGAAIALLCLGFMIAVDPWLWAILRVLIGFALAVFFVVSEAWLNQISTNRQRGGVMGVLQVSQKIAYALGQAMIAAADSGALAFAIAAVMAAVAAMAPNFIASSDRPRLPRVTRLSLITVARRVPSATVGCLAAGLINSTVAGIAPVYGTRIGLTPGVSAILVSMMQIGSLLAQWPLARASDSIDRRWIILIASAGGALSSLLVVLVAGNDWILLAIFFATWGACALSVYPICVAQANDIAPRGTTVAISGSLLFAWSIGSMAGPWLATPLVNVMGPRGLFVYSAVMGTAVALFVAWRLKARPTGRPHRPHESIDHI